MGAYLSNRDLEKIYLKLNAGDPSGWSAFKSTAQRIATKKNGVYLYKDEDALFEVFNSNNFFHAVLTNLRIKSFSDLMQYTT